MPTHGVNIRVEDDETNTSFQFEKYVKKMTRGMLRSLDDNKTYYLKDKITTIGRDLISNVCINNSLVELQHAVIEYVDQSDCFVIEDHNTPHGTYVNDCRVQNAVVRLAHGDVIRLGHGGQRFEVCLHIQNYPPVILQQAWNTSNSPNQAKNSNLPYLPLQSSLDDSLNNNNNNTSTATSKQKSYSESSKQKAFSDNSKQKSYSSIQYGRQNGYHAHNKTAEVNTTKQNNIRPHPPQRTRPVSANPTANSGFEQSTAKPSASFTKDYTSTYSSWNQQQNKKLSDQIMELENQLLKMGDELSRLSSYESECTRKDMLIETLRNDINELQKNKFNSSMNDQHVNQIALLQNNISQKDQELRRLHEENRKMNSDKLDNSHKYTNQIAEMRTHLTRHEHTTSMMENDLKKFQQEKLQLTALINTLQKEATSKDLLIKKWKMENDKLKVVLRNKESELSSTAVKLAKQNAVKEFEQEVKMKDEEISHFRHRCRITEEKLKDKENSLNELQSSVERFRNNTSENERNFEKKKLEHEYALSRIHEMEKDGHSTKTEIHFWKQKFEKLNENLKSFICSDIKSNSNTITEDAIFDYLNDLKHQRDDSQNQVEVILHEKIQLEKENHNNSTKENEERNLKMRLEDMERRLLQNGRSCKSLLNEIDTLQEFYTSAHLQWIKDLIISLLSQERNWERDIETALTNLKENDVYSNNDPTELIRRLHAKLKDNMEKIEDLEMKYNYNTQYFQDRIDASEEHHSKLQDDTKEQIKEKYRKKTEKSIKEFKQSEDVKQRREISKLKEEHKLNLAAELEIQKEQFEKEEKNKKLLAKKIDHLKKDHKKAREDFFKLQEDLEQSKLNEQVLSERLEEKDQRSKIREEILEQKVKADGDTAVQRLKNKNKDLSMKIISLEDNVIDMNKEKKELEYKLICMEQEFKEHKLNIRKSYQDGEIKSSILKDNIQELNDTNFMLKNELDQSKTECNDLKEVIKSLKKDVNGMSARITDLRGDMSDKDKEKVESMNELISKQDQGLIDQRKQLLQLSSIVDEQKQQLIEQDEKIMKQNNALAFHSDEQKNSLHGGVPSLISPRGVVPSLQFSVEPLKDDTVDEMDDLRSPSSMSTECIAERCIAKRHEQIIKKQKLALADMRNIIESLEHLKPSVPSHDIALIEISKLKKQNELMKTQLAMQENVVARNEDEIYNEVYQTRDLLKSASHEFKVESKSHQQTQDALHLSEDIYLKLLRSVSEELELHHILGCSPIGYTPVEERSIIVKEREKSLENILSRIRTLQSRLDRKDKLLESYDGDLKCLRETERVAGKKAAQAKDLGDQVNSYKDEISYLQEALRKCRLELDEQRRLNTAMKQKKVFLMDYKDESGNKSHNCHVDEQKKYKDELKLKRKDELLKKRKHEIENLKQDLMKADIELTNANTKLARLQISQQENSDFSPWSNKIFEDERYREDPVRDIDPIEEE